MAPVRLLLLGVLLAATVCCCKSTTPLNRILSHFEGYAFKPRTGGPDWKLPVEDPEALAELREVKAAFDRHGILYLNNVFPPYKLLEMQRLGSLLDPFLQRDERLPRGRKTICLEHDHPYYDLIYNDPRLNLLMRYLMDGTDHLGPPDFPLEYREYFSSSRGMPWHKDTRLFQTPQIECVYTVDNNSTSRFLYYEDGGSGQKLSMAPEANSISIVRTLYAPHKVTQLKKGERRTIIKYIYQYGRDVLPEFAQEEEYCPRDPAWRGVVRGTSVNDLGVNEEL